LDVPTAGVPTYFVASAPPAAEGFPASGLGLTVSDSGPAMQNLLDSLCYSKFLLLRGGCLRRRGHFPLRLEPVAPAQQTEKAKPYACEQMLLSLKP
jgi:hypothetical protein